MTDDPKKAERSSYPICPACGSTDFYIDGFIAYRQPYDAATGEYGYSEVFWDEDFATAASCANCEKDVTDLFKKFGVLTFFAPRWKEK